MAHCDVYLRWNHTIAFGPTFANVLKSPNNHPNVGDLAFPRVIYWNHTSNVWCLTQGHVCNRLRAFANVYQRWSAFVSVPSIEGDLC